MLRIALPLALIAAYAASPYVSLYEMGQAIHHDNAGALCADIAWDQVRLGLKQDIASGIVGQPVQATQASANSDDLPPFGSGFVSNLAGNVVDRTVTPQHLAETLGAMQAAGTQPSRVGVQNAYFSGPTTFMVSVAPAAAPGETVRLRLDLVASGWGMRWKVTHAWVPEAMLSQSETHAS